MDLQASFLELMKKKQARVDSQKKMSIRDIGDEGSHDFVCDKFIYHQQSNSPEKYFIFERLVRKDIIGSIYEKNLKKGDIEYRISYYIVSRKLDTKTPNKWRFGQYAPMIPAEDFQAILDKARVEGLLL